MGPGKIARKFADACGKVDGVELVAVASTNEKRARMFADEFGIERICSYEEILKREDIDAIYIAVINSLHYDLVKKCLEAGKAILCEKPFLRDGRAGERISSVSGRKTHFIDGGNLDIKPALY